jgi:hypothetical protein
MSKKAEPIRPFSRPTEARDALRAHIRNNRAIGASLGDYLKRIAQASAFAAMVSACGMSHSTTPDAGGDTGTADTSTPDGSLPDGSLPDGSLPDSDRPDTMPPPPDPELCGADGTYRIVHGLSPVADPTWLGAVWGGDFRGPGYIADEIGERCADATEPATCSADVDRIVGETYQRGLVATTGDAIDTHLTPEEINGFLGDIDTAKEAALLVWYSGYDILCSGDFLSSVTRVEDGYRVIAYRSSGGCGSPWVTTRYTLGVYDGTIVVEDEVVVAEAEDWGCVGRRPAGLEADANPSTEAGAVGDFFANIARLEESAVAAFDVMIDELTRLGAPDSLVAAAREAREDEVRHTRSMGTIAERFGAEPRRPVIEAAPTRTAFEIALENAVEGCVRETFGALVGAHQALRAQDPEIARAMRDVADDEIRHAELSWALAGWLEPQLSAEERAQIEQAKRDAVMMLRQQASEPIAEELVELAGVPDAETAVKMVEQLARDVWA